MSHRRTTVYHSAFHFISPSLSFNMPHKIKTMRKSGPFFFLKW